MAYKLPPDVLLGYKAHLPKAIELFRYPLNSLGSKFPIRAYFNYEYLLLGMEGHPYFINAIKNDTNQTEFSYKCPRAIRLETAVDCVKKCIEYSLPRIVKDCQLDKPMVCYVPRSFREEHYFANQLMFKKTISHVVRWLPGFVDGVDAIVRERNMAPSHQRNGAFGRYQNVDSFDTYPRLSDITYSMPGFMEKSCVFSDKVRGKDVILVDDIYTTGVGICEGAIQGLLNAGAKSVTLYTIGRTRNGMYSGINLNRDIKV